MSNYLFYFVLQFKSSIFESLRVVLGPYRLDSATNGMTKSTAICQAYQGATQFAASVFVLHLGRKVKF